MVVRRRGQGLWNKLCEGSHHVMNLDIPDIEDVTVGLSDLMRRVTSSSLCSYASASILLEIEKIRKVSCLLIAMLMLILMFYVIGAVQFYLNPS